MMSGMKKAIGGSIHRIREFELEKVRPSFPYLLHVLSRENWSQLDFPSSGNGISLKSLVLSSRIKPKQRRRWQAKLFQFRDIEIPK